MKIKKHFCGQPYEDGQIICIKCKKSIDRSIFADDEKEGWVTTLLAYSILISLLVFGGVKLYEFFKVTPTKDEKQNVGDTKNSSSIPSVPIINTSPNEQNKKGIDVVSQVLNYSSGCGDDGCSGYSSWVVKDTKSCIYQKINSKDGTVLQTINLNEMDPKSIQVVTMNRSYTERKEIHDPQKYFNIIGYDNVVHNYQTQEVQYMGREIFRSENLDMNRLQRGWSLIYSKYCSGTKKAF